MSEQKDDKQKKTLSLGKKLDSKQLVDAGHVLQSFSHGRSKTVKVEVKKRRVLSKSEKSKTEAPSEESIKGSEQLAIPPGFTEDEWRKRMSVVKTETERAKLEAEQNKQKVEQKVEQEKIEQEKAEQAKTAEESQAPPQEPSVEAMQPSAPEVSRPKPSGSADKDKEDERVKRKSDSKRSSASTKKVEPQRRKGKLTLQQALVASEGGEEEHIRSMASIRRAREKEKLRVEQPFEPKKVVREVTITENITVQELANRMAVRAADVIKTLMQMGMMVTINEAIDVETAELVVSEFGHIPKLVSEADVEIGLKGEDDPADSLEPRAPVVTVMGHVDHGKTSLLDALRATDVVGHESGGITQHIGAYQVVMPSGKKITFIDTPGHAAFTEMRARGSKVTDIVILVVAADDGIKEQSVEAINHIKAAEVPMIVAINKIDLPEANPDRVRNELLNHEVILEELGGDVMNVEISAKQRTNLDKLEAAILVQSELLDLKANPNRLAQGVVIEARMERGQGSVATILVQRGTAKVGDIFVAGTEWGRIRRMLNDRGDNIEQAGPAMPVEVIGFGGAPGAGDDFVVVESESRAREVAEYRQERRKLQLAAAKHKPSLSEIFEQAADAQKQELAVVIKADTQGSIEALVSSFAKLATDEVSVNILHTGVGGITENDVTLANASNGIIIGFNVRANPQARDHARRDGVAINYYSIIYNVIDDIKAAMGGLLAPTLREKYLGQAEVLKVFSVSKLGKIAGCKVTTGVVKRGAKVRLLRDDVVIHEGTLKSLRRVKDEVKEAREGFECGMIFENYQDIKEGDMVECFEMEEIARSL